MSYAKEGFLKQVSIIDCDGKQSFQNEIAEKPYFRETVKMRTQIQ